MGCSLFSWFNIQTKSVKCIHNEFKTNSRTTHTSTESESHLMHTHDFFETNRYFQLPNKHNTVGVSYIPFSSLGLAAVAPLLFQLSIRKWSANVPETRGNFSWRERIGPATEYVIVNPPSENLLNQKCVYRITERVRGVQYERPRMERVRPKHVV